MKPSRKSPPAREDAAIASVELDRPASTRSDHIRVRLSDEIVRGVLAPGVALDETELARRFEVSRTPVREAIRLLAASGLVEARPHRSAVVARPSGPQLLAMFEALQELEALCAGLAAERATATDIKLLQEINRSLARIVKAGDAAAYHEINEQFHSAIYAATRNEYLAELTATTRARIAPFSKAQFRVLGRLSQSHAEHQGVINAIKARDRDRASREMRDHIMTVHDSYRVLDSGG
jgi:DNA-binding GntR family transcriptional regulator